MHDNSKLSRNIQNRDNKDDSAASAAEPFAVPISYHLSHDLLEKMQTDNCRKKTSLISFTSSENI